MKQELFDKIIAELGFWSCVKNKFPCISNYHSCDWILFKDIRSKVVNLQSVRTRILLRKAHRQKRDLP